MCSLIGANACTKGVIINDKPVRFFDLERFLGTWYEIARIDHSFEEGMEYTKAVYSLNEDGTVRVENSGIKNGKAKTSVGKAKRPEPDVEPARLRVSFFGPFYSDYRVLMIDPAYQYALVSSDGPDYLWILARERTIPDTVRQMILTEIVNRGFDHNRLTWVVQTD